MLFLFLLASIPVIVFMFVIYFRDKEREPISIMIKCFLGGLGAAFVTVLFVLPLGTLSLENTIMGSVFQSFIYAAIPEELSKFIFLYIIIWKNRHFDQYYDGIVYAVAVSLGFAWIENIMYVFEYGLETAIVRALFSVPGHGLFGVVMGYFFGLAKLSHNKKYLLKAIFYPVILHGVFNSLLLQISNVEFWLQIFLLIFFLAFVVWLWKIGVRKINEHTSRDNTVI